MCLEHICIAFIQRFAENGRQAILLGKATRFEPSCDYICASVNIKYNIVRCRFVIKMLDSKLKKKIE